MEVLKDRSQKRYSYVSRYTPFSYDYHILDNKYIYEITSQLNKNVTYVEHKVVESDNLDALALKYYGRPDYYWIIADFNSIQDPYVELFGRYKTLKIPTLSDITFKVV